MNREVREFFRYEGGSSSRLVQLDILRGAAILLVLFNHWPSLPGGDRGWAGIALGPLTYGFWTGVDLFFVLSGYLIGGILLAERQATGRIDLRRFWIRRGFKIWPSYYLYILVLSILTALFYVDPSIPGAQLAGLKRNAIKLVYLQNYFSSSAPPAVPVHLGNHTWTLAVEEHFYILLPLVLVALSRFRRITIPMVTFTLMGVCLGIRLLGANRPMDWIWDYEVTHKRIDSLFFGVFLAYLARERPEYFRAASRQRGFLTLLGLALIAPMFVMPLGEGAFVKTIGYTFLALGYGCLLVVFVTTQPGEGALGRFMESRPGRGVAWVGFWSYSIYLWHMELKALVEFLASRASASGLPNSVLGIPTNDLWLLAYALTAVVLGALAGHVVERPFLNLRDRLFPSRTRSRQTDRAMPTEHTIPVPADEVLISAQAGTVS